MEKYGQYRDKGSGIAPFFAIAPPPSSLVMVPWHILLFCLRVPLLAIAWFVWLLFIQWLPAGSALRKANQWCLLGIPGVWWIDLQVDGVRRGSLAKGSSGRLPQPGTIIASSLTSPLDVLYLAAIFDPVFSLGLPTNRKVRPVSLEGALAACFDVVNPLELGSSRQDVDLATLTKQNPGRVIVVFPEGTTSNGRGILKLTPSLLSAAENTKIYPLSLRYTPADVVTPMPGWTEIFRFIWRLNSRQTHCIRVRIGGHVTLSAVKTSSPDALSEKMTSPPTRTGYERNYFDTLQTSATRNISRSASDHDEDEDEDEDGEVDLTEPETRALDAVADTLARLGRVKRVGLGVVEKEQFIEAWTKAPTRK